MCTGSSVGKNDPAMELAALLSRELGLSDPVWSDKLRRLLRCHWSKVAALAHAIHNEEIAAKDRLRDAARRIAALDEDGVMNVVEGKALAVLTTDLIKLADAAKAHS